MADQNDPWAAFNPQPAPSGAPSFGGRPVIYQQPTPKDQAELTRTQQEIAKGQIDLATQSAAAAADLENKRLQAEKNLQDIQNPGGDVQGMSSGFYGRALYANQKYGKGVPPRDAFMQGVADIAPKGIVNSLTGEDRQKAETFAKDFIAATLRKESGAAISPQEYSSQYERYFPMPGDGEDTIKAKANLRESAIAGLRAAAGPLADRADQNVQNWLARDQKEGGPQGSSPPPAAPTETQQGFGLVDPHQDTKSAQDVRTALFTAMQSGQIKSPNDIDAFIADYNRSHQTGYSADSHNPDTIRAIAAAQKHQRFNVELPVPNISDVRGGQNTAGQDTINATARGVADTVSMGTADKLIAAGDTLFKGGPMDYNLARQYAISDFDSENHPLARFGGQALGGAVLPIGDVSNLANLAAKGAGYGAAYGTGSSRSLSDVPVNALGGAVAGAAVPAALAGAGRGLSALRGAPKDIPELVDPATGELNQPMDAMRPADRVQAMRDYGLETITPGMAGGRSARVLEQGLNNVPGSAGKIEDVNSAASGELRRAMQGVAQKFGTSKTLEEGGSELQRGAQQRIQRGKEVISKAYNAIPIADTAPAAKAATLGTLQQLTGRFQSNPKLAEAMHDPKLGAYLDAFQNGDISWKDIKDFRSIIGEKIGDMRFGESSSTSDLRALYGALSEDMRTTAASQGPRAIHAFERANSLNRQNEQILDGALTRILGKDGQLAPEKAAAAVQAMTKGGKSTGDLRTLAQIKAATFKSGAWDEIASTLIHLGGQPANSEGRAFQPATFVNWYADMAEPARRMLFKPELRKALDGFVAMNQQLSRLKGLNNTSNTASSMFGGGAMLSAGAAISNPALGIKMGAGLAGTMAANLGMAKLWTSPAFVKLITGYGRAVVSGNANAIQSQVGRLSKLAATNPEISEPLQALLRNLANDNPVPAIAASPNANDQNQNQQ